MAIRVLFPGALTTVQDPGRFGYQQAGIPCSGVMDQRSFSIANGLTGNLPGAAVLEHTILGGQYLFTQDAVIALTGADMDPRIDGSPCPMYRPVQISSGSVLSLGTARKGCRTYLAVTGGIDVPEVLGSRSTNIKCGIGGYEGRALLAGDLLPVGDSRVTYDEIRSRTSAEIPYASDIRIRVIEGPQNDYFTENGLFTFYSGTYTVTGQSDRMGCRLSGPSIESIHGTDIISDGIVFGSIQITPAGEPIVLMADRQTTGGYAKIATVCTADLPLLAQARPGDTVHFEKITVSAAVKLMQETSAVHYLKGVI
ncbi:MAG: biotin-dependent carboxyltransferase family protein [Candidatus Choladocola sp.]|nr:biotin-dependent carboxyltransferase family protein [Candidatus Choladocola sp.]